MAEDNELKLLLEMMRRQEKRFDQLEQTVAAGYERQAESRAKLHARVDEVHDRMGRVETSVAILGQVDGQVRNEINDLREEVERNRQTAAPAVEAFNDLMKTGRRVSWALGIAGITTVGGILGILSGFWEWVRSALRL